MSSWWTGAVGYQIYIRSFADADGDGIGDLAGIRSRLPHLAELGVDIVWITPFYPSPQADHGYDVADYTGVDLRFGTLEDVRALVDDAHALGLRVVIDLVPNHSSDQHPWFLDAKRGPDAPHRDWYVWREGRDSGPPNNWVSNFGGPAWTYDEPSDRWYMHLFLPEQPDLNWANDEVREAFDGVLRSWAELGVDGFRIDVAHSLVEHPEFLDNPLRGDPPPPGAPPSDVFDAYEHLHDQDRPEVLDIYRRWSQVLEPYDGLLLGEVYLLDVEAVARYVRDGDGLDLAFCFPVLRVGWDAAAISETLRTSVAAGGDAFAWPLSSHDDPHAASRFGGGVRGAQRARAYFTLLCGLPGVPFLFQGDELGLDDGVVTSGFADPIAVRNPGAVGRDGSRTPMIWEPGPGHGFTTGEPWLPFGRDDADERAASVQVGDPSSPLERTRQLLTARRGLGDLRSGPMPTWLELDGPLVGFRRGGTTVVLHVGPDADDGTATSCTVPVPAGSELRYASSDGAEITGDRLTLPPDTAAIVVHG
ncbi:MAG: alpha-amylase family glycosyl hydrolase [Nitriliruptor sp.]